MAEADTHRRCSFRNGMLLRQRVIPMLLVLLSLWTSMNLYRISFFQTEFAPSGLDFFSAGQVPAQREVVPVVSAKQDWDTENRPEGSQNEKPPAAEEKTKHRVAGLTCPSVPSHLVDEKRFQAATEEIVYWRDIPKDSDAVSPYRCNDRPPRQKRYLTFEPDEGGFNNIRMAYETVIALAYISGRVLVLPPRAQFSHLHKPHKHEKKGVFGFDDFFHLESLQDELKGLEIITFQEFLEKEVLTGNVLADPVTGKPAQPPEGRTDWNGLIATWDSTKRGHSATLWKWFRGIAKKLEWHYHQCVAVFPKPRDNTCTESGWISTSQEDEDRVRGYLDQIKERDFELQKKRGGRAAQIRIESYNDKPTPVDAPSMERLEEMVADRKKLCVYDRELQDAPVLHALGEQADTRFLVHFYAFIFAEDYHTDLWLKRFVRDHMRYVDEIQCAAARIVAALHQTSYDPDTNPNGEYHTFHIRRGDFHHAYKDIIADADTIYENTKTMIPENSTVYVATDEKKRAFFEPLARHYRLVQLSDFGHLVKDVNHNYYGMIDQIVASTGKTFVGTYYSTFSGYINRLRGYRSQKEKRGDYKTGGVDSYYYAANPGQRRFKNLLRSYRSVRQAFWPTEFPVCWRDLDHDVED